MTQQVKLRDSTGMSVRETQSSPELTFVLGRDSQLDNLVHSFTSPSKFSILTVDPTFEVTTTTYHHLLLQSVRSGSSPVLTGLTVAHYRKMIHTYLFFIATLIGLQQVLEGLLAFQIDGEKAPSDGFAHKF